MKSEPGLSTIWISAAEGTLFSAARCAAVGGAAAGRSGADCWALPRGTAARAATPAAVLRNPRRPACCFGDLGLLQLAQEFFDLLRRHRRRAAKHCQRKNDRTHINSPRVFCTLGNRSGRGWLEDRRRAAENGRSERDRQRRG